MGKLTLCQKIQIATKQYMLVLCYFLGSVYLEGVGVGSLWFDSLFHVSGSLTYLHRWLAEWAYHCELLDRPQGTTKQPNYSVIWVCRMFTQGKLLCDNNSTHRHRPREPHVTLQQTTINNLKIFCSYWLAFKQKKNLSCLTCVFFLL